MIWICLICQFFVSWRKIQDYNVTSWCLKKWNAWSWEHIGNHPFIKVLPLHSNVNPKTRDSAAHRVRVHWAQPDSSPVHFWNSTSTSFESRHPVLSTAKGQKCSQIQHERNYPPRNGRDLRAFQTGCLSALNLNVSITHFPQLIVYPPHARFKSYLISSVALMWLRGGRGVESSFVVGRLPLWSECEPANEARGPRNRWRAAWTAVDSALETKWTGWQYWGTGKPWGRT